MWSDANRFFLSSFRLAIRLDDKMQYHILTLGRDSRGVVDAISIDEAVETFSNILRTRYQLDAFSIFEGKGYWRGLPENIIRFEVFGLADSAAKNLAATLAKTFNQEAVMLLSVNSRPKFIRGDM